MAGVMAPRSLLAKPRTQLFIGTAGKEGVFYPLGTAMAAVISKYVSEVDAIAPETNGTAENIKMLQEGRIELALAQADLAWAATQGQLDGLAKKVAVRNLLGTQARYLHLVTLADRGIKVVGDLKGKRVSTGMASRAWCKAPHMPMFQYEFPSVVLHVHDRQWRRTRKKATNLTFALAMSGMPFGEKARACRVQVRQQCGARQAERLGRHTAPAVATCKCPGLAAPAGSPDAPSRNAHGPRAIAPSAP